MKLARATLSIVRIDAVDRPGPHRRRPGPGIQLRSNTIHPIKTCRPAGILVARWHVSPETGRVECRWLLEQPPADDYLCAGYMRTTRRLRRSPQRSSLRRRPSPAVTNLSANP
jgi:hypothetical protein